ncbi:MAG TPA: thioredoxin [Acidimicrobiales bacterium]|nr:thioredoxin [Acidimicrobiales bacterium]
MADRPGLPDGLVVVVKQDCATCRLVEPVLGELASRSELTVYTQDDPGFPGGVDPVDDTSLAVSWHHDIETVPSLLRVEAGVETERTVGWHRQRWEALTGIDALGVDLPDFRPGCGSLSVDPDKVDELRVRFGASTLRSRRVEFAEAEDEVEAMFDRGWTDGLPVVPPTEARVMAMLEGTTRAPDEVIASIPPNLAEGTVEKIAVNAVMAGCRPEYLPFVIAAVEASCSDSFNMHGLLATTYFSGPVIVANGPGTTRIGMNSGMNALGQGNRANATIGRALQLIIRNLGGGAPGGVDRATLGNPGKYTFCFAENEADSPWTSLAAERGFAADATTVTLFAGEGVRAVVDQLSRKPESLARSFAASLRSVGSVKLALAFDAMLVVSPEHARVFAEAGWDKDRLHAELAELLTIPGSDLVRDHDGIQEGLPEGFAGSDIPKFRDGGLLIVHAGGKAGLFSGIIGGWVSGASGSQTTTVEVRT